MANLTDLQLSSIYSQVAGTINGAIIFDDLEERFDGPSYVPGAKEGQRATEYNEGRRSVLFYIRDRLKSEKQKPKEPQEA